MMYKIVHGLVVIPTTPYITFSLLHTILAVIALNSWYHLLESMHSVTVTFLPQVCLGMAYQHTLSTHHQLNASNPSLQNFTLHLQVPSFFVLSRMPVTGRLATAAPVPARRHHLWLVDAVTWKSRDCRHWRLHASDASNRHRRQYRMPVTGIRGMESPVLVTGTLATIAPMPAAICDWLMQ